MTKRRRIDGKQGRCCLLWLALVLVLAAGAGPGFAATIIAESSETDMSGYAEPYHLHLAPVSPDGFWHGYLGRPFEDGLSPKDRSLSHARQEAGNCETVLTLELKGFLALHPHLKFDFHLPDIRDEFLTEIVPVRSPGYRRCLAHADMIAIVEADKRNRIITEAVMVTLPRVFDPGIRKRLRPEPEMRLERAAMTLISLAVCHQYPPAFDDFVYLQEKIGIVRLYHAELLYLYYTATGAGIENEVLERLAQEELDAIAARNSRTDENAANLRAAASAGYVIPGRLKALCAAYR